MLRPVQRTRARHRPRHQHLRRALMIKIAIGETHAGDRSAEAALVSLVEAETGLERNPLDGRADARAADLKRIAGHPQVRNGTAARELLRASRTHVVEYPAGAARAVK